MDIELETIGWARRLVCVPLPPAQLALIFGQEHPSKTLSLSRRVLEILIDDKDSCVLRQRMSTN